MASGCIIQYVGLWAAFAGRNKAQERGKTYLNWLLEQQNSNVVNVGTNRDDLKVLWVPESSVGYVTGVKAKTLRNLESKTGTFCFFDKSNFLIVTSKEVSCFLRETSLLQEREITSTKSSVRTKYNPSGL